MIIKEMKSFAEELKFGGAEKVRRSFIEMKVYSRVCLFFLTSLVSCLSLR